MRRLLVLILGLLAAWLGTAIGAAALPTSSEFVHAYTYDSYPHAEPLDFSGTERGPPSEHDPAAIADAVDRWLYGVSARSESDNAGTAATYTSTAKVARSAPPTTTTKGHARVDDGVARGFPYAMVAAKTVDEALPALDVD